MSSSLLSSCHPIWPGPVHALFVLLQSLPDRMCFCPITSIRHVSLVSSISSGLQSF